MHACDIKFVGINVRGTCLISENHEHLYPRKLRYTWMLLPNTKAVVYSASVDVVYYNSKAIE